MTFDEIVSETMARLGLSSTTATTRVGKLVNRVYAQVRTAINLGPSSLVSVTANTVVGSRNVTFSGVQKLTVVYDPTDPNFSRVLSEISPDEMRNTAVGPDPPQQYAIWRMGARTVTIRINSLPASIYAVNADGYEETITLAGAQEPSFPAAFHDILIHGALAEELLKMEKESLAQIQKAQYDVRLSDLRFFLHKSAYLLRQQNKNLNRWGGTPRLTT